MIEIVDRGDYCELNSKLWENYPECDYRDYITDARKFYRLFLTIENKLRSDGYLGWAAYTKLDNPRVMRILSKVGAQPYRINLEYDSIWFFRRF